MAEHEMQFHTGQSMSNLHCFDSPNTKGVEHDVQLVARPQHDVESLQLPLHFKH